nr:hypothetical protein Iba_chr12aCG17010 [Ipomoea batatas]GMD71065.1 hypothetical protein Iba_chr12eCG12370 [Ipomoea batatas]
MQLQPSGLFMLQRRSLVSSARSAKNQTATPHLHFTPSAITPLRHRIFTAHIDRGRQQLQHSLIFEL